MREADGRQREGGQGDGGSREGQWSDADGGDDLDTLSQLRGGAQASGRDGSRPALLRVILPVFLEIRPCQEDHRRGGGFAGAELAESGTLRRGADGHRNIHGLPDGGAFREAEGHQGGGDNLRGAGAPRPERVETH